MVPGGDGGALGASSTLQPEDGGTGLGGVTRGVSASSGFSSVSSPRRRLRTGSDPAQVPAWQCCPGRAEQLHFKNASYL